MRTMPFIVTAAAGLLTVSSMLTIVHAKSPGFHHQRVRIEACLRAAHQVKSGDFIKVEFLDPSAEGVPTYEVEVRDASGKEWELMCDATTGSIYEIEQEVESASDPLFAKHMKVSEHDARSKVLALYPGEIVEIEYEIEANGGATYEFDVVGADGVEMKIEVDAASGEIIEVEVEQWEIGEEPEEMRGQ